MVRARLLWVLLLVVVVGAGLGWLGATEEARLYALAAEDGRMRWSAGLPSGARVVGSPAVADGRVFVGSAGQEPLSGPPERWRLSAFDARTGRSLWEYRPPRDQENTLDAASNALATPALTPGHVLARVEVAGSDDDSLLAISTASGQPAWSTTPIVFGHFSRHNDVGILDDRLLVPTPVDGGLRLRALRLNDGGELWSATVQGGSFGRNDLGPFFAASSETFYVSLFDGIVALDAATGAERFRVDEVVQESGGQLALADGLLIRRTDLTHISAYDARTGERRWAYSQPFAGTGGILRSFGVSDGLLVASCVCDAPQQSGSSWLLGIDLATGAERWRAPLDAHFELYRDMPVVGAGIVVTTSEQDDVVARSASDGSPRWRFPREAGSWAAIEGDLVYVTDRAPRWRHWLSMLGIKRPT